MEDKRRDELFYVCHREGKDYFYREEIFREWDNRINNNFVDMLEEVLRYAILHYNFKEGKFPEEYNIILETL